MREELNTIRTAILLRPTVQNKQPHLEPALHLVGPTQEPPALVEALALQHHQVEPTVKAQTLIPEVAQHQPPLVNKLLGPLRTHKSRNQVTKNHN
jgi:hypothetical protein